MSDSENKVKFLDAEQVVFLPVWARACFLGLIGLLAISATFCGVAFLFYPEFRDKVAPILSIAQTAAAAFAVVLFVIFAEKQLSTDRLYEKTNQFLDVHLIESLSRIELPQIEKGKTVIVVPVVRGKGIHGKRKDIYGSNYEIKLGHFKMRMWVGINVKRLGVIYFAKVHGPEALEDLKEAFKFTFGGAEKVGYHTNFEYALLDGEHVVSMWSTAEAEHAILGNPSEQLFWVQDVAMMTQSIARTGIRNSIDLYTNAEPGPL